MSGTTQEPSLRERIERVPRNLRRLVVLAAATALFSAVFHPLGLTVDTYDYLFRSFHILAYGSHPFGFGLLLRALAALAHPLWPGAFSHLFTAWQLACLAVIAHVCVADLRPLRWPQRLREVLPLGALGAVTVLFFAAPMLYLTNGYMSEMTAFALLALSALAFARAAREPSSAGRWLLFGVLCVIGYHVRYQHTVVPLAAVLAVLVRFLRRKVSLGKLARRIVPIVAVVGAVPLSQACLAQSAQVDEYGLRHHEVFLRKSIQCTLKCDVRMFQTSCDSAKGRHIIETVPCWRMIGVPEDEFGSAYPKPAGMLGTMLSLDGDALLEFIVKAPVGYLQQMQDFPFHLVGFAFDRKVDWFSEHVPEVLSHYAPHFGEQPRDASPAFDTLLEHMRRRYAAWWYHWLAAAAVYISCVALLWTRDWAAGCLYATTIGTFFLMSYLHPQFPMRYSMHIALPALLAAYRDVLGRLAQRALTDVEEEPIALDKAL